MEDIIYMQDITPEICANTPEADAEGNNQFQLKDSRDQKTYWVAKLKDGNCWMTQNLDYNGGGTSTAPSSWGSDNAAAKYFDPGMYVYTTPLVQNQCPNTGTGLSACTSNGWRDTSSMTASTDPNFYTKNNAVVSGSTYDAHYLAGNYYSWIAATNGSGAGIETNGTNANDSICPTGWQLPTSSTGGQFATLTSGLTASTTVTTNNLRLPPYYFVYGGDVYSSSLYNAGSNGYYWSSTAYNATQAYYLYFGTGVNPSYSFNRYYGYPVRCVARSESTPDNNVEIMVNPTINLDVAGEVEVKKSETNPSAADLKVKVASNQPYTVNINAKDHAELISENGDKIPSNGGALTAAENNWGIQKPNESTYTKVTTTPQLFYQSTVAESKTIPFIIGISTSPDLPNGEYSTDITITATQN